MLVKEFTLSAKREYSCECASIDVSEFPMIVQNFKILSPSLNQIDEYIQVFKTLLSETIGKFVIISILPDQSWSARSANLFFGGEIREVERQYKDRLGLHIMVPPKEEIIGQIVDTSFGIPSYAIKFIEESFEAAEQKAIKQMGLPFL